MNPLNWRSLLFLTISYCSVTQAKLDPPQYTVLLEVSIPGNISSVIVGYCGGALIARKKYVLTAASCFIDQFGNFEKWSRVLAHTFDQSGRRAQTIDVTNVYAPYRDSLNGRVYYKNVDIAIAKLKVAFIKGAAEDVKIPRPKSTGSQDTLFLATFKVTSKYAVQLYGHGEALSFDDLRTCLIFRYIAGIDDKIDLQLCAKYKDTKNSNMVLSGSPLIRLHDQTVFGVYYPGGNWVVPYHLPLTPVKPNYKEGWFADVSQYRDFIRNITSGRTKISLSYPYARK